MNSLSDSERLRRYAEQKDEEAFAALVRDHLAMVYHAALRQLAGDGHRAEEVALAVFADLARKAAALSRHPALASWLHTAVRFSAAKMRRAESARKRNEKEAETMNALLHDSAPAAPEAQWERLRPLIDDALHQLGERDRTAILLRYFEGRSFATIGAALSLSEDAARMRVERALKKLRRRLERAGMVSTAAALEATLTSRAASASVPPGLAAQATSHAFASVALNGPLNAGLFSVFSAAHLAMSAVSLAMMLTLGFAGFEWLEAHRFERALAAVNRSVDELLARERGAELTLQSADQAAALLQKQLDQLRLALAAKAKAEAAAKAAAAWDPVAEGNKFMDRHPEVRQALDAYGRARVLWKFGPMLGTLNLTPDQEEKLFSLLEKGFGMGGPGPNGPYDSRSILMEMGTFQPGEWDQSIRQILTDEQAQEVENWWSYVPARGMTSNIAGELWDTPTPLTPDQATALIQLIGRGYRGDNPAVQSALVQKAGSILAPAQLEALATYQETH